MSGHGVSLIDDDLLLWFNIQLKLVFEHGVGGRPSLELVRVYSVHIAEELAHCLLFAAPRTFTGMTPGKGVWSKCSPKAQVFGTNSSLSDGVIMLRETYLKDQPSAPELPGWRQILILSALRRQILRVTSSMATLCLCQPSADPQERVIQSLWASLAVLFIRDIQFPTSPSFFLFLSLHALLLNDVGASCYSIVSTCHNQRDGTALH